MPSLDQNIKGLLIKDVLRFLKDNQKYNWTVVPTNDIIFEIIEIDPECQRIRLCKDTLEYLGPEHYPTFQRMIRQNLEYSFREQPDDIFELVVSY